MEDTSGDQQTKIESDKSTRSQDGGPRTCTTTHISSGNNSGAKTLIEHDIDESVDIKEETVQDEEVHQRRKHNHRLGKNKLDEKCIATEISFDNNSCAKTLIEYDIDESLDIKEEIIQDQERHQWEKHNLCTERNELDEKYTTAEISSVNNSGAMALIKYDSVKTLAIKQEFIQDQENIGQRLNTKYDSKLSTLDTREDKDNIMTVKNPWTSKEKKIQESKSQPKKKYKCEKCSRNYVQKRSLNTHQKFECDVTRQFICKSCGKQFKQKGHMNTHMLRVHQKTDSKVSKTSHNCDKCSRSYSFVSSLNEHERVEHAAVRPQFICDICGFSSTRKYCLSQHITSRHVQKNQVSITQPKNKYNCDKCSRSYVRFQSLYIHKKFECDVIPQFSCESCGKRFKRKSVMSLHIEVMHLKTKSRTSKKRLNCDKCSRNYSSISSLNHHKRVEHASVKPQFICYFCCFQTTRKCNLSQHITLRHFQKMHLSVPVPEKKYKCQKCRRTYSQKINFNRHKKFKCDIMPRFECSLCGKQFKQKGNMNTHILRIHQKTDSTRLNCDKCSQSYNFASSLNEHKLLEHATVRPQFICDSCGFQTKRKYDLSRHITARHF